jgi:hypothetical protein
MDLESNPEKKESGAVYQEVPNKLAAVETGRAPNKRHSDQNLAAECCRKPKDGSQRKLVTACRGTTHCGKVAWHKGNVRKKWTRDMVCGTFKRQTFGRGYQPKLERKLQT